MPFFKFFDVRVTHPRSSSLSRPEIFGHLRSQEHQKKRAYCQRVNNVERAAFTPLVFSTFGMAFIFMNCFPCTVRTRARVCVYLHALTHVDSTCLAFVVHVVKLFSFFFSLICWFCFHRLTVIWMNKELY